MNSAFHGAGVVDTWLRDPALARPLMKAFDRTVRHGISNFSWFIYRVTSPAIRQLFMRPGNYLRTQEALLSLLAGDLFRGTPTYWSLRAFKGVYCVTGLLNPRRRLAAWRPRRQVNQDSTVEGTGRAQA